MTMPEMIAEIAPVFRPFSPAPAGDLAQRRWAAHARRLSMAAHPMQARGRKQVAIATLYARPSRGRRHAGTSGQCTARPA